MSDTDALRELARSMQHIETAIDEAENENVDKACKDAFESVTDAINKSLDQIGEHSCENDEVEIKQETSVNY